MNLRYFVILMALSAGSASLLAQESVHGTVLYRSAGSAPEALPDARVGWAGGAAAMSDSVGHFVLPAPEHWPAILVTSSFTSAPDSLLLEAPPIGPLHIIVQGSVELAAAVVSERQASTRLSLQTLQAIESIGARELKRAAC